MRRGVIAVVTLLAIGLCLSGTVAGAPDAGERTADIEIDETAGTETAGNEMAGNETTEDESANGFGQQISSFVQSTSSEADGAVEQGVWESRIAENGSPEAVNERAEALESRLSEARAEREALREARRNGSITRMEFVSRMAQLNGELRSVASAADDTASVAAELEADTESLQETHETAAAASASPVDVPGVQATDNPGSATDSVPGNGPGSNAPANGTSADDTPANDTPADGPSIAGGPTVDIPGVIAPPSNVTFDDGVSTGNETTERNTDAPPE